jgi:hypothetical protein
MTGHSEERRCQRAIRDIEEQQMGAHIFSLWFAAIFCPGRAILDLISCDG